MSEFNIGGFEVIERIGAGGMATVWKARQVTLDRTVAIKILSSQLAADPADVQRFQKEAQAAARLKHPGIVQVYDANVQDGIYYFVMEYVAGYTVGDWLRRKGVLPEKDALLVAECVADALQYAWETAGIIHCDIKPDNVIVDADGSVKVADLGLARTISAMSAEDRAEDIMGTPAYISPEQATGEPDLDFRADIYSLGASLYQLVTGRMMFQNDPEEQVMELQITHTVPDAMDVTPQVSLPLCWLLEKMLAKDKENRYSNWAKVRKDIERVKAGLSPKGHLTEQGHSTMERSRKRTRSSYVRALKPPHKKVPAKPNPVRIVVPLVAAALFAAAAVALLIASRNHANGPSPQPPGGDSHRTVVPPDGNDTPPVTKPPVEGPDEGDAARMFQAAKTWEANNPGKYGEAIRNFTRVARDAGGTRYEAMAEAEVKRLQAELEEKTREVFDGLRKATADLIAHDELGKAADILEDYSGPLAQETRLRRMMMVKAMRRRERELAEGGKVDPALLAAARMRGLVDDVVVELVASGPGAAEDALRQGATTKHLVRRQSEVRDISRVLLDVRAAERAILRTFGDAVGKQLTVDLVTGRRTVTVRGVQGDSVVGVEELPGGRGTREVRFGLDELSAREKLMRLGTGESPSTALVKGLMALRSNAYSHARRYFKKTDCILTERLLLRVTDLEEDIDDAAARDALRDLLYELGIPLGDYDHAQWLAAVRKKGALGEKAIPAIEAYHRRYGRTQFARGAEAILLAAASAGQGS